MRKQTLLLIVTVLSLAAFLPALQSGVGGGGQSNIGGGGSVTYPLLAPNGSLSAPSYAFSGFPNTGAFVSNVGTYEVSVGGLAAIICGGAQNCTFGTVALSTISTNSNCTSSASPAVCGGAPAGNVVIAAAATTVQVNTSSVTANSQIFIQEDDSLGAKLSVTCNTTSLGATKISARTAATSFTITTAVAPTTNPACLSYWIIN